MRTRWRRYRVGVEALAGSRALALGSGGVAVIGLAATKLPPGITTAPDRAIVLAASLVLAALAAAALASRYSLVWRGLAAWWLTAGVFAAVRAAGQPLALPSLVPLLESLTIGLACAAGAAPGRPATRILTAAVAIMLAVFGAIHILYRADVGSLAPAWVPWREQAPLLSGAIMLGSAAAMLAGRARIAALVVAAMFVSWLPLVHAPLVIASNGAASEWLFALIAICLIGVLLRVAAAAWPKR